MEIAAKCRALTAASLRRDAGDLSITARAVSLLAIVTVVMAVIVPVVPAVIVPMFLDPRAVENHAQQPGPALFDALDGGDDRLARHHLRPHDDDDTVGQGSENQRL